jgi:hypothetical protein
MHLDSLPSRRIIDAPLAGNDIRAKIGVSA